MSYLIKSFRKFVIMIYKLHYLLNLLSAYDMISSHAVAVMQWPVSLNTSCCSSGLTQHF
jgi:hypothetical protein